MWARISRYQVPGDRADESVGAFESAMDELRGVDGIERAYYLLDRESGRAVTVTVWRDEQALRDSASSADELRERTSGEAGLDIESVESYELALDVDLSG